MYFYFSKTLDKSFLRILKTKSINITDQQIQWDPSFGDDELFLWYGSPTTDV